MKPITPAEVLRASGHEVPEFVIQIVNRCLIDMACAGVGMYRAEEIFVHKDMIRKRVRMATGDTIEGELGTYWRNFPYYFAKDWDIQLPGCEEGVFRDFYIFSPKGVVHRSDHSPCLD